MFSFEVEEPLLAEDKNKIKTAKKPGSTAFLKSVLMVEEPEEFSSYQPPVMVSSRARSAAREEKGETSSSSIALMSFIATKNETRDMQREISDEVAHEYLAEIATQMITDFIVLRSESGIFNCMNTCMEPREIARAEELRLVIQLYRDNKDITDALVKFIKTGVVDRVSGESSFDSSSLRGIFIDRFVPYYQRFKGEKMKWMKAASIRQEIMLATVIDEDTGRIEYQFDEKNLLAIAKKELNKKITALEAKQALLQKDAARYISGRLKEEADSELREVNQLLAQFTRGVKNVSHRQKMN